MIEDGSERLSTEEMFLRCVEIRQSVLGSAHPAVAEAMFVLISLSLFLSADISLFVLVASFVILPFLLPETCSRINRYFAVSFKSVTIRLHPVDGSSIV